MYTELLKLCGYKDEEIEKERPRVEKAFQKLGIGSTDIERGEKRAREQFDTKLEGVRKLLGIWMKEMIDLTLAKDEGKKIVYGNYPPIVRPYLAVIHSNEDLYVGTPEVVINIIMGSLFDKLNPILETAEVSGLAPGLAHCSLLQARLGAIVKGIIPMPDFILNSSHLCDQAPKTDELLHELYGIPVAYMDSVWDQNWGDWPETKDRRIEYLGARITMALEKLEEVLGYKVTDEGWHAASRAYTKGWINYQTIIDLVMRADPQPISQVDLGLIYYLVLGIPHRRSDDLNMALMTLAREVNERVEQGKGVVEKGAPRIAWYMHSTVDPEMLHMVEGLGLAVPLIAGSWVGPLESSKPRHREYAERYAETSIRVGLLHSARGVIERWKEMCTTWNLDGMVQSYLFSCRPICLPAFIVKKGVQDDLGIPVLALEYDVWDKRDYGAGQLRTRIETFAELLKAAKSAKG